MKKKQIITLCILFVVAIALILINTFFINPHHLEIRKETILSNKIDENLDGTSIAYFADIHYGLYTNDEDIVKLINKCNLLDADIVLFGGDLIDESISITEDIKTFLINQLSQLKSNYHKYAVLGEEDIVSSRRNEIINILMDAGFEILNNSNIKIYAKGNSYFNLVGMDSQVSGSIDVNSAFAGIANTNFTLAFTHCPDSYDLIDTNKCDYLLAGHSHGGQVYLPLINLFNRENGYQNYIHGKHKYNQTTLDITNGVGLSEHEARLLSDAEVVFYQLKTQ